MRLPRKCTFDALNLNLQLRRSCNSNFFETSKETSGLGLTRSSRVRATGAGAAGGCCSVLTAQRAVCILGDIRKHPSFLDHRKVPQHPVSWVYCSVWHGDQETDLWQGRAVEAGEGERKPVALDCGTEGGGRLAGEMRSLSLSPNRGSLVWREGTAY